jgi:hypothetical protein
MTMAMHITQRALAIGAALLTSMAVAPCAVA